MKVFSILLIRLLAVYLAITPLMRIAPLLFNTGFEAERSQWLPWLVATAAIPMMVGTALWWSAAALANKIHEDKEANSALTITEEGLVRAGCFLIGVYLFVQHVGAVLSQWAWAGTPAYGSLAVILLSIGLVLGVRFMGKLYRRLKYFE